LDEQLTSELGIGLGLYTGQRPNDDGEARYRDAVGLAVTAERSGFDSFWVSEHHGFADGYLPAPLTVLAAIASRTERITLGTGVVVSALAHPIHLAEQAAVVDHLSDGRLVLGLGLGYAEHEYRAFGVDTSGRGAALTDLVAFLRTAWTGEEFDWDGPCYRASGVRVTPTPRRSRIPIWLGGYADAALDRAARLADGYLLGRADPSILQRVDGRLRDRRAPEDPRFTFALNVMTIFTDEPGTGLSARQGLAHQQRAYDAVQQGGIAHAGLVGVATEPISPESVAGYAHAYGTVDQVTEQLRGLLGTLSHWARVHLVIRALFPEASPQVQRHRITRMGRELLPALRAAC